MDRPFTSHFFAANIKFSKTQISKTIKLGWFLAKLFETSMKAGLSLMKKFLTSLPKRFRKQMTSSKEIH